MRTRCLLALVVFTLSAASSSSDAAGLGPFYVVRYDAGRREVGRQLVAPASAGALVDGGGNSAGTVSAVAGSPLPTARFQVGGDPPIDWDGDGSTGLLADGTGGFRELVRPSTYGSREQADGASWLLGFVAGALLWIVYRDSFWRRSVSV